MQTSLSVQYVYGSGRKYVPHSFYGKQKTKDNFSTLEIVLLNRHSLKIITTSSVLLTI